jgi:hypothetical protein
MDEPFCDIGFIEEAIDKFDGLVVCFLHFDRLGIRFGIRQQVLRV